MLSRINFFKRITGKNYELKSLLNKFEHETIPKQLKEHLLGIAQLYYDGLIENRIPSKKKEAIWKKQEKALDAVFQGLRMIIVPFYEKKEIPIDNAKNLVLSYDSTLMEYSLKQEPKSRHLRGFEDYVEKGYETIKELKETKLKNIDLVIAIASGAFEPSMLYAHTLEVGILPARYSRISRTDKEVRTPRALDDAYFNKKLSGSKVLIVEDVLMKGTTLREITKWATRHNPEEIYCMNLQGGQGAIENVLPSKKINSTFEHAIIYKVDIPSLKE